MTTKITEKNISNISNASVQWQSVITAAGGSNTAVAGEGYFIDTTSNTHTINLPATPNVGDTVAISDPSGTFSTNNVTVGRNGEKISNEASDVTLSAAFSQKIYVYSGSTYGWSEFNSEGTTPTYISATGGSITTSGDYKVHTFTGDGSFIVCTTGNPVGGPSVVDYLVVAGGGGGHGDAGGGGGAGGFRVSNANGLPAPTMSPLANPTGVTVSATTYPITVGAGGTYPSSGSPSIFSTITSAGGGGTGGSGGSGGGARANGPSTGGTGNTPPVTPSQGNDGGDNAYSAYSGAAGGGGAGAAGTNNPNTAGGAGGVGSYVSPSLAVSCAGTPGPVGSVRYFSGGGGGSYDTTCGPAAPGGAGGGGNGVNSGTGNNGSTNTGGGAGGGRVGGSGSTGGKGIVILRYKFQN